uniref:Uncharacterized protein n=1 Tax=Oryza brachyantha TaxID=4533 RepID=J3LHB0_ORYBR
MSGSYHLLAAVCPVSPLPIEHCILNLPSPVAALPAAAVQLEWRTLPARPVPVLGRRRTVLDPFILTSIHGTSWPGLPGCNEGCLAPRIKLHRKAPRRKPGNDVDGRAGQGWLDLCSSCRCDEQSSEKTDLELFVARRQGLFSTAPAVAEKGEKLTILFVARDDDVRVRF